MSHLISSECRSLTASRTKVESICVQVTHERCEWCLWMTSFIRYSLYCKQTTSQTGTEIEDSLSSPELYARASWCRAPGETSASSTCSETWSSPTAQWSDRTARRQDTLWAVSRAAAPVIGRKQTAFRENSLPSSNSSGIHRIHDSTPVVCGSELPLL